MPEDVAVGEPRRADAPTHRRIRAGMRVTGNWLQLIRFGAVGGTGFVVNLVIFWLLVHPAGMDYRLAAIGAYPSP